MPSNGPPSSLQGEPVGGEDEVVAPSMVISKGTYAVCARPANWPAYAIRTPATCSAVYRQLHSSRPARGPSQSRSVTVRSSATELATASSTRSPPMVRMGAG